MTFSRARSQKHEGSTVEPPRPHTSVRTLSEPHRLPTPTIARGDPRPSLRQLAGRCSCRRASDTAAFRPRGFRDRACGARTRPARRAPPRPDGRPERLEVECPARHPSVSGVATARAPWLMICCFAMLTWTAGTSSRRTVASALTAFRWRAWARSCRSWRYLPSAQV